MSNIEKDLKITKGDYLQAISKVGLQSIPCLGGIISEIFNMVIVPPLERRRDKWLINIFESLSKLQDTVEGFKLENLKDNELFITILMQATQIALKNHQDEKLMALHNAVINAAIYSNIDETEQLIFLNYINELSVWHIKILDFFNEPIKYIDNNNLHINDNNIIVNDLIDNAFPNLRLKKELVIKIIKDLYNNTLINISDINYTYKKVNYPMSLTTKLGKEFLKYISINSIKASS